ncbi:MAG: PEP/pyruvate-binding domain-containing protein [Deltaproteobacteria bacterium]|nr:PEP/pyruvate-binding domain-containing protein [Deltaproteobacteria bacterium]
MWSVLHNLWKRISRPKQQLVAFPEIFEHFQALLADHQRVMELIADLGEKSGGEYIFDRKYLIDTTEAIQTLLLRMVKGVNLITSNRYLDLYQALDRIFIPLGAELRGRLILSKEMPLVISLAEAPEDRPELIGGKASHLAVAIQNLSLPVPGGFIITTRAYRLFLEHNHLEERIHALLEAWVAGEYDERQVSRQIQYSILAGVVPHEVAGEIRRQAEKGGDWAVRSSAYGEDGELSFAGLHESLLHVPSRGVIKAYKQVLASLYSPEALVYRQKMGMLGEEAAMAVLCQEMIPSQASGVVHTLDVSGRENDCLVFFAAWGLGRTVVEGKGPVDRYVVERDFPHRIRSQEIAQKEKLVRAMAGGGEEEAAVAPEDQSRETLSEATVEALGRWALILERYFKRPQEIECAIDAAGNCWVLQARGLQIPKPKVPLPQDICETCARYPILIQDVGVVAHAGVGAGVVAHVSTDADLDRFPEEAVLVAKYTAPWLARIVPKAAAIVAERGSAAGHLATIAREFRVPTLVGVEGAMEILTAGMKVTVDTKQRTVYAGRVKELLQYELVQSMAFEDAPEFRLLRRILARIAPLHLLDPQDQNFTPEGCQSVHDVIRFIHEKAVEELMDLPRFVKRFKGVRIFTLVSDIPLGLKVLDLGGGIAPEAQGTRLLPEHIRSAPMRALWEGLSEPGVWSTEPVPVDFQGMMSSLTKTGAFTSSATTVSGFNLAVISENYLNLHLRLGYHFNLVDARMETEAPRNHIYFRFVGGVTDLTRRSRRAQLLEKILSQFHFKVDTKGDLVVAKVLHLPREDMEQRLRLLGRLIGFTRQLDIQLRRDEDVPDFVEAFFHQNSRLGEQPPEGGSYDGK